MELTNYNTDKKFRRKAVPDLSSMMYGKVPPQAKELEEAVLGAIMLEKGAFDRVIEFMKPETFYVDANQRIFKACIALAAKNSPVDLLTVVEELKNREELDAVGGPYYVTKLTSHVVSSANIEAHGRIVYQKFVQREIIRISGLLIGEAYEDSGDPFDLLDTAEKELYNLSFRNMGKNFTDSATASVECIKHTEAMRMRNEDITGVPSGFISLDSNTGGWQDGDLIVLAARPSVGKTAFALNLARNAVMLLRQFIAHKVRPKGKHNVGFFSLEMSTRQLTQRIVSAESEVPLKKVMRGQLDDEEMKKLVQDGFNKFSDMGIFIDDTPSLSLNQVRTKARIMVSKYDVGLIIIDYLQLMDGANSGDRMSREQEISKISRGLKGLAKELHVPIIALSQLSRDVEKRATKIKMPQLSDLRDSGAIEQDADCVLFLYRPEYYEQFVDGDGEKQTGETHVRIAKHRNGALETIKLKAKLWIQKFEEMTKDEAKKKGWQPMAGADFDVPDPNKLQIGIGSKMVDEDDYDFKD